MCYVLCTFMVLSCGLDQLGEAVHSNDEGIWTGPSFGKYDRNSCYALTLDYPEDYDWRSDSERGEVKCELVMLQDGIPVLRIPAGGQHEVSVETGRQRMIDGHLYTDYTDGVNTVIRKDGKLLYRYAGAEQIKDMKVVNGSIHTLGVLPDGDGFRYRVDGESVVERTSSYAYMHMDVVSDTVIFYFRQPVAMSDGVVQNYYKVKGGKVTRLEPDTDGAVFDIRMADGDVILSVGGEDDEFPALIYNDFKDMLEISIADDIVSASILNTDIPVVCIRYLNSLLKDMTDILWLGGNRWHIYRTGCVLTDVFVDDMGYNAVINPHDGKDGLMFCGNKAILMPEGYSVCSGGCMVRKDSILYIGLSSNDCGRPLIWNQNGIDTLDVNGPVIALQ